MDLNIGLHSLKVAGLFVSKRRGGWIIELMPGMVWSKEERWILEPSDSGDQSEKYEEDSLFALEEAIQTAITISSTQQNKKEDDEPEEQSFEEESESDEKDEAEAERECQACQDESIDAICRIALQVEFPLPIDNRLGDSLTGRASFTGPFFLCKSCLLEFLRYYIKNHIGRREKSLKEDLNFIIDLLHNDEPLIGIEHNDIQRMLTTIARVYYPILVWTQLKADNQLP